MIDATRKTYFAPYDDCESALLSAVTAAQKKIRLADYSYNLENLTQQLIQKHQAGVDVQCVLDKSQAGGKTEVPEIQQLKDAGVPLYVGTSTEHKIMHDKYVVIDDAVIASGSYNFTGTAEHEDNFLDVEHSPERAAAFSAVWDKMSQFIKDKEPTGVFNV